MIDKKRSVLIPEYMLEFRCIGSACEDCCCGGWRIDIDHETYKKYKKIRDTDLAPLLNKNIARTRGKEVNVEQYAQIRLKSDASCPFLDENRLCMIQLKRDESYLSNACATYPRTVNSINGVYERSASVSCPEVARKALLNPCKMSFVTIDESRASRNIVTRTVKTDDIALTGKPQKYLLEIRKFAIALLQNRQYPIDQRLIILGMFVQKLQNAVNENRTRDILDLIASYTTLIEEGSLKEGLENLPTQPTIQMQLLKEIAEKRYMFSMASALYFQCFSEFLKGVEYTQEASIEEIGARYQRANTTYYEPFMSKNEHILENFLVNHIFKHLFPFTDEKSLFDSYMMLVIQYALVKMHLIGMAGHHKEMNNELVIKLVHSFSKSVEHTRSYLRSIANAMQENGFNTLAYMTILIKS